MLVKYRTPETPENCFVVDGKKECKPDEDGSGGFTVAAIVDSPIGAPPTEARPAAPATDTDPAPGPRPATTRCGCSWAWSGWHRLPPTSPARRLGGSPSRTPGRGSNPPATPRRPPSGAIARRVAACSDGPGPIERDVPMLRDTQAFSGFSVDDLEAAKRFYGETLGLDVTDGDGNLSIALPVAAPCSSIPSPTTSRPRSRS